MRGDLSGRVAIVTGAGRGIGRATAVLLAREGVDVGCVGRDASQLADTAADVVAAGGRALVVPVDLADRDAPCVIVDQVLGRFSRVDMLVNNAASLTPLGPTLDIDSDDWARAVEVNLVAPFRLTSLVVPAMVVRGWGRVVDVSSGAVAAPDRVIGANAYVASKAGLEAHALNVAAELAGTGVTFNVVRPPPTDTPMYAWARQQPAERIGPVMHTYFHARNAPPLVDPSESAQLVVDVLRGDATGRIVEPGDTS